MAEDLWISTAAGRLYARRWRGAEAGSGAPIVLFHDSLGAVSLWRDFPENLARATGRDVIAYDRLGFGLSDPHPGKLGPGFVEAEVDAFAALHEQLGLDAFVAFGHSVGGAMASNVAAAYPQACRALITESAQAFVEDRTLNGIRAADVSFAEAGQLDRLARYHGDKAEWVLRAWVDTWLSDAFQGWSLTDVLPRVTCPALAIHGDDDEYGSLEHPRRFASLTPHAAPPFIVTGCGHVPHREKQQAVVDAVAGFLKAV
ncbi:alpha/beta fold hydrolase [Bordetella genomosp. 5]|nr:alpha/beta hydrolase [Bordetella genomosp. 5]